MSEPQKTSQELFGDSSSEDDQDFAETKSAKAAETPAPAATNKELFGDSDSDEDDDSEPQADAKETTAAPTSSSKPTPSNTNNSDDDDEGDVEFDDAGAVVGVKSTSLAGQVRRTQDSSQATKTSKTPEPPKILNWKVLEAQRPPSTSQLYMTKLPNVVGIQPQAFDPNRYDPDEEEAVYGGAAHNLIRWRYKTDATGHLLRNSDDELVRESNTRLVQWEDGSWTIHVGTEAFEVDVLDRSKSNDYAGLNGYLYLSHPDTQQTTEDGSVQETAGTILESMGRIHSRLVVKPGLQSEAHKALTLAVRSKTIQTGRIATVMTQDDPERLKQERIKLQTELAKARSSGKRAYSGGGGGGNYTRRPRLSKSYLEGDDAQYDSVNIRAMKKGARDYGDEDDDEDDYGDDFIDDDEDEDDDEIFNRKTTKPGKKTAKADEPVANDEEDSDDDDEEEETFVKKPAAAKKNIAVLDDDDDSD